jgi:3',5'-cyclic AMP phosphodiesterase CpdA
MKFIQISDLHFHRHERDNEAATTMLQFIKQNYPDHKLIVTGDITDDGHEEQYKRAYEGLEPFKGNIFISPGNHDFGAAGNFYSRERGERFDEMLSLPLQQGGTFTGDLTPVVNLVIDEHDKVMLIALDTNLETDHPFDFACGEAGERQLSFLNTVLSDQILFERTKILFFHHHPFIHNDPLLELKDARELMRTIYQKVDIVCFGHKHVSNLWQNINGIQYILASDNSPGKDWAREIEIRQKVITVKDIPVSSTAV